MLANDTDPDGDDLNMRGFSQPANGTVVRDPDHTGRLIDTPREGFLGFDSFTYRVGDGHGADATAAVTVYVENLAPTPVDDERSMSWNRSVNLPVLANDTDPDGDSLNIRGFTQPRHGKVERDANHSGRHNYTPNRNFVGTDTFTYRVGDGMGLDGVATVRIRVSRG